MRPQKSPMMDGLYSKETRAPLALQQWQLEAIQEGIDAADQGKIE